MRSSLYSKLKKLLAIVGVISFMPAFSVYPVFAGPAEMQRAEILVNEERAQAAIPLLESIVRREPNNVRAWFLLGAATQELANFDGTFMTSRQYYIKALSLDPKYAPAYTRLAQLAGLEGNWKEEIRISDKALTCAVPDPYAYKNKAIAHSNLHEDKLALADFEKFVSNESAKPTSAKTLETLATFQENAGHYDDAIKTLRRLQELNKQSKTIPASLATCLGKAGKYNEALSLLDKLIKADREEETLLIERAKIYTSMGKYSEAIKDYDQSIELVPSKRTYLQRAALWEKLGNKDKAKADRQKSDQM